MKEWNSLRRGDCTDEFFQPIQQQVSVLVLAALSIRSTIDETLACSKKNSVARKRFVCVAKHIAATTLNQTNSS